jgi:hypothetical protein
LMKSMADVDFSIHRKLAPSAFDQSQSS